MNAKVKTVEELVHEIKEIVEGLDEYKGYEAEFLELTNTLFFYDKDDEVVEAFECGVAAEGALRYYAETGNSEAEINHDNIKFFTIEVVK